MHLFSLSLLIGCQGDPAPVDVDTASDGTTLASTTPLTCAAVASTPPACGDMTARDSLIGGPLDAHYLQDLSARSTMAQHVGDFTKRDTGLVSELLFNDPASAQLTLDVALHEQAEEDVYYWHKSAGAYAGVSIAADAFRYGSLRDEGADCAMLQEARQALLADLDALHAVQAITGTPGVIARGLGSKDKVGTGQLNTTPLFNNNGDPLPAEKTNGTWREDNSGLYPNLIWEDSVSRDQYIGWVAGIAGAWEVIANDDTIDDSYKTRLQTDATQLMDALMTVQESGYDLELQDADGRPTYHAPMHHNALESIYLPGAQNGLYALMSLGVVAGLTSVTNDEDHQRYLQEELLGVRDLAGVSQVLPDQILFGTGTNWSNLNMAYIGGYLTTRYLCDQAEKDQIQQTLARLHDEPIGPLTPIHTQQMALYDLVLAFGEADAYGSGPFDDQAAERVTGSLGAFPAFPNTDAPVNNCDEAEIESGMCELNNGAMVELLGYVGRGDKLIASTPIDMSVRPPSNYVWRSSPFEVNGGAFGQSLHPSSDWRFVYWAARWTN